MTQTITVEPNEEGTAVVTITPTDEDDNTLTFDDLTSPVWQLMRANGSVVNDRSFANCTMTSLSFVLSGDDLSVYGKGDSCERVLSFYATYNSTLGNNLPLVAECEFNISPILGRPDETP
jgi:hypothetical protein